jgi:hypothetical protein
MYIHLRVGLHNFMNVRHVMKYYLLKLLKLLVTECVFMRQCILKYRYLECMLVLTVLHLPCNLYK